MRLPPVWGADGAYGIVSSDGETVMLRHKFSDEAQKPLRALPADQFKMIRDPKALQIEIPSLVVGDLALLPQTSLVQRVDMSMARTSTQSRCKQR